MNMSFSAIAPLVGLSVFSWCVLALPVSKAAVAPGGPEAGEVQVIEYESGGRVHRWVVSPDEVCVVQPGRRSAVNKVEPMQGADLLAGFEAYADQARAATHMPQQLREQYSLPEEDSPAEYHPVVYPEGKVGRDKYRGVLKPLVNVVLSGPATLASLETAAGASGGFWVVPDKAAQLEFASVPEALGALASLNGIDEVERAYPEISGQRRVKVIPATPTIPTDPLFSYDPARGNYQWHLRNVGVNGGVEDIDVNIANVWGAYTGSGVVISIVDDGLDTFHPDLFLNTDRINDWDFNGNDDNPNPNGDDLDGIDDDHGTSVGGVAGAAWNNGIGGVGSAPESTLIGLRVLGDLFNVTEADFAAAVGWTDGSPAISNNSWGPGHPTNFAEDPLVVAAMQNLVATGRGGLGTIFCFAAGNDGADNGNANHSTLTAAPESIAVGAINDGGTNSYYSTPGACVLIGAPSGGTETQQGITTTTLTSLGSYTDEFSGTSSATPLVSGCIALMLEANPALGWRDVQEILIESAYKNDRLNPGWLDNAAGFDFHHHYGSGMMDARAAVELAETWVNLPPRQSIELVESYITGNDGGILIGTTIPDAGQEIELVIDASNYTDMRMEHAVLNVDIEHLSREQLDLTLISPSGTASDMLVSFPAADPDNTEEDVSFDFPLMSLFNWGENFAGIWRLRIRDTLAGQEGQIFQARLTLYGTTVDNLPPRELPGLAGERRQTMRIDEFTVIPFIGTPDGATVTFTGGTLPAGLIYDETEDLIFGTATELGEFPIEITVTNGPDSRAFVVVLVVGEPSGDTLAEAIEQTPGSTNSSGTGGQWLVDIDTTFDASDSAASPDGIADDFYSDLVFTNPTAGVMVYSWRVSSFENNDRLWFFQGGNPIQSWRAFSSGQRGWGQVAVPVTAGATTWRYEKNDFGSEGEDKAWVDQVSVIPEATFMTSIGTTLGTTEPIRFNGKSYWLPENSIVEGTPEVILRSSSIGNGQHTGLVMDVEGPAEVTFEWRVDSGPSDYLYFMMNGYVVSRVEGSPEWAEVTYEVPAGSHEIEWRFSKDLSFARGADAGYLRSVSVAPTTGYGARLSQFFSAAEIGDPSIVDPDENPDGDAFTNFEEYIFGGDPTVAEAGPLPNEPMLVSDGSGGFLYRFDLPVEIDDVAVEIQSSTALTGWVDTGLVGTIVGGVVRYEIPVSGVGPREFFRVFVEPIATP